MKPDSLYSTTQALKKDKSSFKRIDFKRIDAYCYSEEDTEDRCNDC